MCNQLRKIMENKQKSLSHGIAFVLIGASSYGMLATFVKTAYQNLFSTAEVTLAQYLLGIICLAILTLFSKNNNKMQKDDLTKLLLAGICFGLTSVLYYISIRFLSASIGVVLLMQSVWIGVVIESIQQKKLPNLKKTAAVLIVLAGTLLATDALNGTQSLDYRGVILGFLAAISFSLVLLSTNSIALHLSPAKRSLVMLFGGAIVVALLTLSTQILPYYFNIHWVPEDFISNRSLDFSILYQWGIPIALFGTVIPPLMFNKGFPIVGVGLGSILSAFELPVSIVISFIMLGEIINSTQWLGVVFILLAIIMLNINFNLKTIRTQEIKKD